MSELTERLLDTLAIYSGTQDAACMTLPSQAYTDPGLYEREVETIFKREWLLMAAPTIFPIPVTSSPRPFWMSPC